MCRPGQRPDSNDLPQVLDQEDVKNDHTIKLREDSLYDKDTLALVNPRDKNQNAIDKYFGGTDMMIYRPEDQEPFFKRWDKVTEKERTEAKDKLKGEISPLIPEADRARLQKMQEALIDGDPKKMAEALKDVPPEKMKDYLKELNKQLKENGSDVKFTQTKDGKVLVYSQNGTSAVEIDPKTGNTSEREIRHTHELPPRVVLGGEILDGDPAKALKKMGDEATRDITNPWEILLKPRHPWHEPITLKPFWEPLGPWKEDPLLRPWKEDPLGIKIKTDPRWKWALDTREATQM